MSERAGGAAGGRSASKARTGRAAPEFVGTSSASIDIRFPAGRLQPAVPAALMRAGGTWCGLAHP
jgi:hypothetical protein